MQFESRLNDVLSKTIPVVSSDANSKHAPPNPVKITNVKCTGKANLTEKGINVSNSTHVQNVQWLCFKACIKINHPNVIKHNLLTCNTKCMFQSMY